ncbi:hypothetical protein AXY43_02090 [Clostridium sp. MF28]|uniref:response regulator transcription factor n=1 Tax=Clostridium TaxID=1485 RepID=UPI000CF92E1B|nr:MULTISPECIES: response regulator [Clostridium]AVK46908.1 hypothetical protein AXY43_02090 [Clostridium sp. MF28]PSM59410.1 hypothetical protein C4L39_01320 [Clostridium diolis]
MNIVVIEDEIRTRRGIIKLLPKINENYHVIGEANDGLEGFNIIEKTKPQVVITDIKMPGLNGLEMLKKLNESEIKVKMIIITAYSEFEFAKKAISVGVTDYLLKPITVEDLKNVFEKIEKDIDREIEKESYQRINIMTFEQMIIEMIEGKIKINKVYEHYSGKINEYNFNYVIVAKLLNTHVEKYNLLKECINNLFKHIENLKYILIEYEYNNEILILFASKDSEVNIEKELNKKLFNLFRDNGFENCIVAGLSKLISIDELASRVKEINRNLKWSLLLKKDVIVTENAISSICTKTFKYPKEIEQLIMAAIGEQDYIKLSNLINKFLSYCKSGKYHPDSIIDGVDCFVISIINIMKDINYELFIKINNERILEKVKNSTSWCEIEDILKNIINIVSELNNKDSKASYSLIVYKTINKIINDYAECISLENIAASLNVTPEYLSTLFYKEVGTNFTSYLKEYRINKSKELLISSNLKIGEIAKRVGYNDPKYFCKVFKSVTGVCAGKYVTMHK